MLLNNVELDLKTKFIEEGKTREVFSAPQHEYTRQLVQASVLFQEELC